MDGDQAFRQGILMFFYLQYLKALLPRQIPPSTEHKSHTFLLLMSSSSLSLYSVSSLSLSLKIQLASTNNSPSVVMPIVPRMETVAPIFTPTSTSRLPTYMPRMCPTCLPSLPIVTRASRTDRKNELICYTKSSFLLFSSHLITYITFEQFFWSKFLIRIELLFLFLSSVYRVILWLPSIEQFLRIFFISNTQLSFLKESLEYMASEQDKCMANF